MREPVWHFDAAPWSVMLIVSSTLATILVVGVALAAFRVVPYPPGFTHDFGVGVALLPLACLAIALLFVVTGYTISPDALGIGRLFWTTVIPLSAPVGAELDPTVCRGSLRLIGNAGLFAFTGLYRNKRLGMYRLFATDFAQAVVLKRAGRTIVVSPASSQAFVDVVHHLFPGSGSV